ncbi:MAG: TlpA disulfide reductase family protein [bacterium]|nr:TlpA disulfide reductase family protein [bacterium]
MIALRGVKVTCGVIVAAVLLLSACSGSTTKPAITPVGMSEDNESSAFLAPDFTLTTLVGEPYTLSALRGRWVVLNFWATFCETCPDELAFLEGLAGLYPDELVVLTVNMRETKDDIEAFLQSRNLNLIVLVVPDDTVLKDYNVVDLPQTLVISPEGEIVMRQFGPIDLTSFGEQLDARIKAG